MLQSTNNPEKRVMPILEVISAAMKYLKDTLMKLLQDDDNRVEDSQVRWVVTVPAIWQAPARQLMREAAYLVSYIYNTFAIHNVSSRFFLYFLA